MAAGVIGYIGRLRLAEGDDADLLRAYARERDADAFAALVRRHGGRVWATCRRVAGDPHAAEDAFQATFLVLARKASGLPESHPLGGWLHAVAVNVSVRARTAADRRKRREVAEVDAVAPESPAPPDERSLAALDEEIERLPAKLRDAVVLCELDGLSRKDAAARLGVPEGTVSSRLAAARKRLAERLKGRGVRPELLAVPAAVPAGLVAAACGPPSAAVLTLTGGTMRALLLKGLAAGAVACGMLAVGGRAADDPPAKPAEPPKAAKPAAVREGVILLTTWVPNQPPVMMQPDGTQLPPPAFGAAEGAWLVRLSPDGRRLAAVTSDDGLTRAMTAKPGDGMRAAEEYRKSNPWDRGRLHLFPLHPVTGSVGPVLDEPSALSGAWGPGGRTFYGSQIDPAKLTGPPADGERRPYVSWVYDVEKKVKTPLAVPPGLRVVDVSADGRLLLTRASVVVRGQLVADKEDGTFVVPTDTFAPAAVGGAGFQGQRLSPDGTRVLGAFLTPGIKERPPQHDPAVVRLSDSTVTRLKCPAEHAAGGMGCWSPDGRRIALVWSEGVDPDTLPFVGRLRAAPVGPGPHRAYALRVSVLDADGSNHRVIVRRAPELSIHNIDWR